MTKIFLGWIIISLLLGSCAHKSSQNEKTDGRRNSNAESEPLIRYTYAEGELLKLCEQDLKALKDQLASWQTTHATPAANSQALLEFELLSATASDQLNPLIFMASVSKNAKMREEASKCEELAGSVQNEIFTNRAFYNILKTTKPANPSEDRLKKEILVTFEQNGMKLNDSDLKKYKALADRLSQLSVQFGQNLNNDVSTVIFTEAELAGVKSDFMNRLKKDDKGNFIVTTKAPDYIHVMENATQADTRKKMMFAYNNRQAEKNTPILQEAVKLRAEVAKLMGYPTFAEYSLREKMAGNSKTVWNFLNGLKNKLRSKNKRDLKTLADFKKNELKDSSPLVAWDINYLSNQLKMKKYQVDEEVVRGYFPADHVVMQTLDIYSQILGLQFRHIKGAPVWDEAVDLYEVVDQKSKQVIAYFYADLIPREGKYGHAAAFSIISGRRVMTSEGEIYQKPIASIVTNFTPASPGKPILLSHDEIETFFHEFGHIMHQIITRAPFASLAGTSVKRDFVEAPSQMLENWVWETEILQKMSKHYADPKKTLPPDLIARIQKLRLFNTGIQYTRQLVFGLFDMEIHTQPKADVTKTYARIQYELTGFKPLEGTHFPATFGHMMGGYSAGYYGYLWSKVYAEDMYSEFLKQGILNPQLGQKYRTHILEQGNMSDPMVLIKNFLGREPNNKAFFKSLGL